MHFQIELYKHIVMIESTIYDLIYKKTLFYTSIDSQHTLVQTDAKTDRPIDNQREKSRNT